MSAAPVLRTFVQYLIAFCSRPETASDFISGKYVKFRDPGLNRSREIPPETVIGDIFDRFFNFDNCQLVVASDIISGDFVYPDGLKLLVKFDGSWLNLSRDIRMPLFVTNDDERHRRTPVITKGKTPYDVLSKK